MEILQAIGLGILEGFTEFLPVSSTGHLIVAQELIGYKDTAKVFTVVVQLGAIAAVIWNFRQDLINRIRGLLKRDKEMMNFWLIWVLATIPGGLAGFFLRDSVSSYAVAVTVAFALIIGGVVIWLIENFHKAPQSKTGKPAFESIKLSQAVKIGFCQALALIPGVSRSGSTIMGGLIFGLDRVTAASFSFYLSIPILLLAGGYQIVTGYDELSSVSGGVASLVAGVLAAFVTALIVIKWLLRYVYHHDFKIFAYYRIILGIVLLLVLL